MSSLASVVAGVDRWHIAPCDCRFGMSAMPDACVDAIVCDPPYELGFMGRRWDSTGIAFNIVGWAEAIRVLKPGGHLVAFGGTRTYHRMACAIEDAGFEIRDCLAWMYGSGFPKSLDISKAIDRSAGATREVLGPNPNGRPNMVRVSAAVLSPRVDAPITALATPAARAWSGYGTALKPAFEPCILARKPLDGTVAANVLKYGTGALNIDGCRIDWASDDDKAAAAAAQRLVHAEPGAVMSGLGQTGFTNGPASLAPYLDKMDQGRWPANVLLDEAAAEVLDAEAGERPSGIAVTRNGGGRQIWGAKNTDGPVPDSGYTDSGGPSRFFYTAKASRSERDAGLDDFVPVSAGNATGRADGSAGLTPRAGAGRSSKDGVRNTHPTVKPVDLMRWLVRLVSRPGSLILDPFCGSGSTGIASMIEGEGRRFIGLELDPKHVDIARARIVHVIGGGWEREVTPKAEPPRQPSLFDAIGARP